MVVDRRQRAHPLPEHAADLAAGRVAGVQHAPHAVRRLAAERRPAVGVAIEPRAPVDAARARSAALPRRARAPPLRRTARRRRESCRAACSAGAVVVADRRRDAALRVAGVALRGLGFGEDEDAAGGREPDRRAQAGDAAADDEKICASARWMLSYQRTPHGPGPHRRRDAVARLHRHDRRRRARSRSAALLDESRAPGAPLRRLEPARLAAARRAARAALAASTPRSRSSSPTASGTSSCRPSTRIYDALVRANADRASTLITFGGGVIGDMAGFAAATYLRGIALVHVPTTLLAQVDSAIGGKVGVNHPLGKNLIGAFYQPHAVVIDPTVLGTLPRREFRAGLYEVIKYGMTSSAPLFDRDRRATARRSSRGRRRRSPPIIAESCRIKADVVSADEREAGPRRILNFGHTAGHALEAVTKYRRFRHGEAVAYGMLVAAELAAARGALADRDRQALADLIASLGPLPPIADVSAAQILEAMQHDKKIVAGRLHFVLPTAIGATTIVDDVTEKEMKAALKKVGFRKRRRSASVEAVVLAASRSASCS